MPNLLKLATHIRNLYLYGKPYIPVNFDKKYKPSIFLKIVKYFVILKSYLK